MSDEHVARVAVQRLFGTAIMKPSLACFLKGLGAGNFGATTSGRPTTGAGARIGASLLGRSSPILDASATGMRPESQLFVWFPFEPRGAPCRENADNFLRLVAPQDVGNQQHELRCCSSNGLPSVLITAINSVVQQQGVGVSKHASGQFKTDAVFSDIGAFFSLIPFKLLNRFSESLYVRHCTYSTENA